MPTYTPAETKAQVHAADQKGDAMCGPVDEFLKSVQPGEIRNFEFHTTWGGNFKDSTEKVLFAARCNPCGYGPAKGILK